MISKDTIILDRDVEPNEVIESTAGKVIIRGNIGSFAVVKGERGIEANDVSSRAELHAALGEIHVKAVKNQVAMTARLSIEAGNIGSGCYLRSENDFVEVDNIGRNNVIRSHTGILCKNVGENNKLNTGGIVKAGDIQRGSTINAIERIEAKDTPCLFK